MRGFCTVPSLTATPPRCAWKMWQAEENGAGCRERLRQLSGEKAVLDVAFFQAYLNYSTMERNERTEESKLVEMCG